MRMEQVIILIEQRMERIGHKDAKFYCKYNQYDKSIVDKVIQRIIISECINGWPFTY